MATRRDQFQSYQFLVQRVLSAFVMRETDPAQSPLRRGIGAVFAGAMIAVILCAGFAVFGLITKIGSGKWRVQGAVVIEKETGAPFVYRDNILYPMVNYTSAVLAGDPPTKVFRESRRTLSRANRGNMLGIPNAPASLPDAKNTVSGPWTLCAVPGTNVAGRPSTSTSLILGSALTGRQLEADDSMLVRNIADESVHLVWQGRRFEVKEPDKTLVSLFGAQTAPTPAAPGWITGLPLGTPIAPLTVADANQPSSVTGRRVGELIVAQTGSEQQFYVVMKDGLAAITELQKAIYTGQTNSQPVSITVFEANSAPKSAQLTRPTGDQAPPVRVPRLVTAATTESACAQFRDARSAPTVSVVSGARQLTAGIPTAGALGSGTSLADRVYVPPGKAVLVTAVISGSATAGAPGVITDIGMRYPIATPEVVQALGYPPQRFVPIPASLVNRIPPGPTLDQQAARTPVDQQVRIPGR
ncbi:type VII secretion protein EccB [Virgisporangium ochraceum]|jgi:type VII secretion protein EccB|uniref:ESX-3 secretion system ATPase EccB3 n=1 Tax=Virgisporangium ochraceum TaxID=65505 RepID=A0A8J3ZPN8_9ACTN|nr:type VII secretion protein EccB [Virgisporangium ochraceum]GIJ67892.1 ESX-3 secretion system ATPase EccB3 [Virgisporangium ochraceum]